MLQRLSAPIVTGGTLARVACVANCVYRSVVSVGKLVVVIYSFQQCDKSRLRTRIYPGHNCFPALRLQSSIRVQPLFIAPCFDRRTYPRLPTIILQGVFAYRANRPPALQPPVWCPCGSVDRLGSASCKLHAGED